MGLEQKRKDEEALEQLLKDLAKVEQDKITAGMGSEEDIEINKEKTDERLNQILKINNKIFTILSGKWNTSVGSWKSCDCKSSYEPFVWRDF